MVSQEVCRTVYKNLYCCHKVILAFAVPTAAGDSKERNSKPELIILDAIAGNCGPEDSLVVYDYI